MEVLWTTLIFFFMAILVSIITLCCSYHGRKAKLKSTKLCDANLACLVSRTLQIALR